MRVGCSNVLKRRCESYEVIKKGKANTMFSQAPYQNKTLILCETGVLPFNAIDGYRCQICTGQ